MPIIDTHCHVSPDWYEPIDLLLFQMDRNGVERATLVQMMGQFDNSYQADCVARFPDRLASVVLVDVQRPDAGAELRELAAAGAAGVRLRCDSRSPGSEPLAIWRVAEALGLPVSCGGDSAGFADPAFAQLVQTVPRLPIIVEHLGSLNRPDGELAPYPVRRAVFDLARYPNVYLKIHGLGEFLKRNMPITQPFPFAAGNLDLLEMAYQAFGPARMLWGSDYPPVSGREGYANALGLMQQALADKGAAAGEQIFGGTAMKLYWGGQ